MSQNPRVRSTGNGFLVLLVVLVGSFVLPSQVTTEWTRPTGGVSVAVDRANHVYTLDYVYALGAEMRITKRDAAGIFIWETSFDQTDFTKWERAAWIATDEAGNVLVGGTLMSGYSNPVVAASIAMKFDPSGGLLWRRVFDGPFDGSSVRKVLVDGAGNSYFFGLGMGPNGLVSRVKKFSPDGTAIWDYFDTDGIGAPLNAKFTPDGGLLMIGRFVFGNFNGYAKIDATSGTRQWGVSAITSATAGDAAGDRFGNSYLVFAAPAPNSGTALRKVDASGVTLLQTAHPLAAFRVEVGSDDAPVLCGFPNQNAAGAAFVKTDPSGNQLWANLDADGPLQLLLHAQLTLDDSNDAYLAAGTLFEMAICKVRSNGSSAWTRTTPGSYANGMALGRFDRSLFVIGGQTARLSDSEEGPFLNLGQGLEGSTGVPILYAVGTLTAGSLLSLHLENALPQSVGLWGVGLSSVTSPLLGGILVPSPDYVFVAPPTDLSGRWQLDFTWPAAVPSGLTLFTQVWLPDPQGSQGASSSNALRLTTP